MNKTNRLFGIPLVGHLQAPLPVAPPKVQVAKAHVAQGNEAFQPLPVPTGAAPYRITLESVLSGSDSGRAQLKAIQKSGKLVLHTVGDTGGIMDAVPQTIVVKKMAEQLLVPEQDRPAFFYHLGDVVYFKGEAGNYFPQFYEAYQNYTVPVFAIPGNHDGTPPGDGESSLGAFMRNFCNVNPVITPEAVDVNRTAMTQPNCFFTLEAPFVTLIGLYSNVPSGGRIEQDQLSWFIGELKNASKSKALIVAVHHPIYSADDHHSGSTALEALLDGAYKTAKRLPDAVLNGHVHNFQRFTRQYGKKTVPYFVAGAGGYHNLHGMQKAPDGGQLPVPYAVNGELQLDDYAKSRHGFVRVTASKNELLFEYFTVPRPHESWSSPAERFNTCRLDWRKGIILPS
ncbi:MAG: metallophosphoesterase [Verrucomicrobiota bacterium]|nr:metallophosphoesterase [Verrucomicrobiota bacterium]